MPALRPTLLIALLLALAACGGEPTPAPGAGAPEGAAAAPPGQAASPAVGEDFELAWLGVLPCADCDGIQTRLSLRSEGGRRRYELQETYLGAEGDNRFEQQGDWVEEGAEFEGEAAVVYRLDPPGPGSRRFRLQADGALELLDSRGRPIGGGLDYRLQRL